MSEHRCSRCGVMGMSIEEDRKRLIHMMRQAEAAPGTARARGAKAQFVAIKERLAVSQQILSDHIKEHTS